MDIKKKKCVDNNLNMTENIVEIQCIVKVKMMLLAFSTFSIMFFKGLRLLPQGGKNWD